ncbi:MAG: acyl-phosphate glycerol 3-phosphate acyltransferase [Desulfobulbaceae bacterium S3730MH12]|nr:MAG: acyl-phosphate glycerol 3-phosphate acyltransferase [Desulfobulbaceae bacterium S3730MH12]
MHTESNSQIVQSAGHEQDLLQLIRQLIDELHPGIRISQPISLDSSLERDLGLDSLARVELLARLEQSFDLTLSEHVLATAESPRDLLRHIGMSGKGQPAAQVMQIVPPEASDDTDLEPYGADTLLAVLESHVQSHPNRIHIILERHNEDITQLTYQDLKEGALKLAAGLQCHNIEPGDTVAIMLPTGQDYFFSFFAVLLVGGIPVPLYPPARPTQIEEHLKRHRGILRNARAKILITMPEVKAIARLLKAQVETLELVDTVDAFFGQAGVFTPILVHANDVAFIQYTSGSTGDPKGVVLTHANLLANIRAMGKAIDATAADVFVSWLPLYHDMGLIGAWLGSLYYGFRLVIMQPLSFLARPERWLWAIHNYHGTISASPNFGYEFCYRRLDDEVLKGLDLSSWRLAFNGAEPVSPETIINFEKRFVPYGFRPEATSPVYGLAESAVGLAFPPLGRGPFIDRVKRGPLIESGQAVVATEDDITALRFVACGRPLIGHQIRIVDESGRELPDRHQGELQFKGPSVTSGYFRNPEKNRSLFRGEWLGSGDLAYIAEGDIFITSRIKDIIIRGGRNVYPHELEEAVGNIPGIRKGCIAVFASQDQNSGTERLIVLAESREKDTEIKEKLHQQIINRAVDLLGMPPDEVLIAPPGTVLKTSSGKIRRAASRELYEKGEVGKAKRALWLQLVRLSLAGILPQSRRLLRRISSYLYASYCWLLFGLIGMPLWLLVALLPGVKLRWKMVRRALKLLTLLSGTRMNIHGLENIVDDQPMILVSNHASYLDSLVLSAALPISCNFVAKAELAGQFFARVMLSRLDVFFIERFDVEKGLEDARKIGQLASSGKRPLFFAEGTLQRMTGLLPFQMGAFVTAAHAGIPVLPLTIRGTRNKLRGGSWFLRKGRIGVIISKPVEPKGSDWNAAVKLRDAVRSEILHHCGEPDLATVFTSFSQMEIKRSSTPRREK